MASRLVAAAASSSSLSSASPLARLISRRGLAGAADGHGSAYEAVGALLEDVLRPQRQRQVKDAVRETRRDAEIFN
uniref:Uncharacterized protein n=1 Tax=Zea mays TaxID=4577 RepID=B6TM08_MAIZE|nr:hypothetical protein [Zea mays]